MDRRRVLHVIWSANLGGITRIVQTLCEYQMHQQHTYSGILVCKQGSGSVGPFLKTEIVIQELGLKSGIDIRPLKLSECTRKMGGYDVIHLHIFHPVAALAAILSGKKIIFTEHGNFGLGRAQGFRERVIQFLKTRFLKHADVTITCNSAFTAKTLSRLNRISEERLNIIHNGIPDYAGPSTTCRTWKKPGEFLVVSIGRLAKVKRFDRVIQAFNLAGIESSRLLIMGDGPERESLEQIAKSQELGRNIVFVGQGDSLALLTDADLCLIGSQGEAFGLVAVEAYQAGKRVLVFDDGGGVIEITGTMDPESVCADVVSMADQIRITLQSSTFLNPVWAEKAKRHAKEFSLRKMADAFNRLYQS